MTKRFELILPSMVSMQAMNEVWQYVARKRGFEFDVPAPHAVGMEWMNKLGTFPKRYARLTYMQTGRRFTPEQLAHIGQLARRSCNGATTAAVSADFTTRIDWCDGDFGDNESCFWGSKSNGREALERATGFEALRLYKSPGSTEGIGRVWTVKRKVGTTNMRFMFNAYGPYQLPLLANALAQHQGKVATRVVLVNNGVTDGGVFINGATQYVLHPRDAKPDFKRFDLKIPVKPASYCDWCGNDGDGQEYFEYRGENLCEYCYNNADDAEE